MAYFNSDRSQQSEKTKDINEHTKKGALKGRKQNLIRRMTKTK